MDSGLAASRRSGMTDEANHPETVSRARLRLFDLDRGEFVGHNEIVVVERQGTGNAVLVKLEADRIDRRLLAGILRLVLVEIADRDRPARDRAKLRLVGRSVGVLALVGREFAADHGERI